MPRTPEVEAPSVPEDADVPRLLDDDHEEDREDAKAGHGDDEEQEQVQNALLDRHRGEQGPLFLLPGLDAEVQGAEPIERCLDLGGEDVDIDSRLRS